MITVYNANNLAQQWFFQRAYLHLEATGKLDKKFENPNKTFLSLESYFANIGTLIRDLKATYAMIPSDEEPFEINANTRAIKVPAAFAKGVAVVGDDMSEVITFTIDRYFDYVDLGGTDIYVQWILPGEDGGTGISKITLIDFETIPGKIRFGWPLTDKLTQHAGKVTFAVRFVVENKTNPNKYDYVFNTSPATINIMPGMNINIADADFPETNIKGEFDIFVENSQNPYLPNAESPFWTDERKGGAGKDLELDSPAAINVDEDSDDYDSLTLTAQALVNGNGYIDYKWYFQQGGKDPDGKEYDAIEILADDERFIIDNTVYELVYNENGERTGYPKDNKRVGSEQYYTQHTDGPDGYLLYLENELDPADGPFYERFTTLTIKPRPEGREDEQLFRDVTGKYWVQASNYVGEQPLYIDPDNTDLGILDAINKSTGASSSPCVVPTPKEVTVEKEPTKTVFIDGATVELKAVLSKDEGKPFRTYSWYKNTTSPEMVMEEVNLVKKTSVDLSKEAPQEPELELTGETLIPGWYYFDVDSQLNRAIADVKSTHPYRVVEPPKKPELILEYCVLSGVENIEDHLADPSNWIPYPAEGVNSNTFDTGDLIRLRVRPEINGVLAETLFDDGVLIDNIYTDEISYDWYIVENDNPNVEGEVGELLTGENIYQYSDIDENGLVKYGTPLHSNYLDVWCQYRNSPITSFYCVVTNRLDDRKATFDLESYGERHIFEIW